MSTTDVIKSNHDWSKLTTQRLRVTTSANQMPAVDIVLEYWPSASAKQTVLPVLVSLKSMVCVLSMAHPGKKKCYSSKSE